MSIFAHLYDLGARTPDSARPGPVTPSHAIAGIAAADKLAAQLHVDIERSAVRPAFKKYWRQFYNRWITYRTLRASHETMADPTRVMDMELPNFLENLQVWRNALASEPGGRTTIASVIGQQTKPSGIPWKPILLLGAGAAVTIGIKWWWSAREREKAEAAIEAARAQMGMQLGAPGEPTVAATMMPAQPGWPMPAMPWVPPGYMIVPRQAA